MYIWICTKLTAVCRAADRLPPPHPPRIVNGTFSFPSFLQTAGRRRWSVFTPSRVIQHPFNCFHSSHHWVHRLFLGHESLVQRLITEAVHMTKMRSLLCLAVTTLAAAVDSNTCYNVDGSVSTVSVSNTLE